MPVKFNQYWRVNHDRTSDYAKFVVRKYIHGMNRLGIHIVAGWTVLIGGYSEILLEGAANDLEFLEHALRDSGYKKLMKELQLYTVNYKTKVLVSTGRHDSYSTDVREGVTKVIQAWDVVKDKESEYVRFVTDELYPALEDMSIRIANEWEVLIGDGPRIVCEGRADKIGSLIESLRSESFQHILSSLKKLVYNYESRILTAHICKDLGYKAAYYSVITV